MRNAIQSASIAPANVFAENSQSRQDGSIIRPPFLDLDLPRALSGVGLARDWLGKLTLLNGLTLLLHRSGLIKTTHAFFTPTTNALGRGDTTGAQEIFHFLL